MDKELLKILLVDDNEDSYVMLQNMLEDVTKWRHELDWISNYDSARKAIARDEHNVYLVDYRLGENTGLGLLREAIENGGNAPIILLFDIKDQAVAFEAMEAGAADYLIKGKFDAPLLERAIRYAIKHKESEEQIIHMAYYDPVTNLPNRLLFMDRLKQAISRSDRFKKISAVLHLDLDNFKQINSSLGHSMGDLLLQSVANELSSCLRKVDSVVHHKPDDFNETVSRFGGDEFTILLSEIADAQNAAKVAQRIINVLTKPFSVGGYEVFITGSIGIAVYPYDGNNIDTLLKNADSAMYYAKSQGKNNYQFYKQDMNATAIERLSLENDLRRALTKQEFLLYYQPQVDIKTGDVVGMEALVRWPNPDRGMVTPGEFIPMAEENGLILPLGEWVLKTACMQNKEWQTQGFKPMHIAVNLSVQQFKYHHEFIKTVIKALQESTLDPQYLELELTENILMQNTEEIINVLYELKGMGVQLAMDDFGTGYSSLSYLKRIPLDVIKIALPFVKGLPKNQGDVSIVKAIISMGHSLNIKVIAEGVETAEQLDCLCEYGCDEFQGYYFSKPLPAEEVVMTLKKL